MQDADDVRLVPAGTALPDPDLIRRAALQASWARDRKISRQRILRRWVLWALVRLLMLCALVGVATWMWSEFGADAPLFHDAPVTRTQPTDTRPLPIPDRKLSESAHTASSANTSVGNDKLDAEGLRLEHGLQPATHSHAVKASDPASGSPMATEPRIELKPDFRLHNKEH